MPPIAILPPPSIGGGTVPAFSQYLYVDGGTVEPVPTQDGSVGKPYSTIQAAINAAAVIGGDVGIYITPGTYVEYIDIPDIDNLGLIGADANSVRIVSPFAPSRETIRWTPLTVTGPNVLNFYMANITVENTHKGDINPHVIYFNAFNVLSPNTFLKGNKDGTGGAYFYRVNVLSTGGINPVSTGFKFSYCGRIWLEDCYTQRSFIDQSSYVTLSNCRSVGDSFEYIGFGNPENGIGRGTYRVINHSNLDGPVSVNAMPDFELDTTSLIRDLETTGLQNDNTIGPILKINGTISGTLVISFSGGNAFQGLSSIGGHFLGPVVIGAAFSVAVSPTLIARHAVFDDEISVGGFGQADFDIRDCSYSQGNLTSIGPNGSFDRSRHTISSQLIVSPQAVVIAPPFPVSVGGNYQVNVSPLGISAVVPFITAKTNAGFTVNGPANVSCDLEVVRFQ